MLRREFARVFGVDFFSVITRGSQFKVESFMFRVAKPESFVLVSPSRADVSGFRVSYHSIHGLESGWKAECGRMHASYTGTVCCLL
jgi:hypothetical protein